MSFIRGCMLASAVLVFVVFSVVFRSHNTFVVAGLLLSCVFIFKSKLDITSPDLWFVVAINIYHLSIFALDIIGFRVIENKYELTVINFFSLLGYFTASSLFVGRRVGGSFFRGDISISHRVVKFFLILLFVLTVLISVSFLLSGAVNKAEFDNQFGSVFSVFNMVFILYLLRIKKNKYMFGVIIGIGGYLLTSSLLLGERNIFLSFMLLIIFFSFRCLRVGRVKLFLMCGVLVALIPILGQFKNVFTRGGGESVGRTPIIISVLNGEFRSAGYNINHILSEDVPLKYGASLVNDFLRVIVPRFVYPVENSVSWYNATYHPDIVAQGRGYGFSLAAEGFINFGLAGVYAWFFLAGVLISWLYNKSYKSSFYFVIYLIMIPVFIYAVRGDFSTIFSPLLKQVLFPYLLMYISYRFFRRVGTNL